jgi:hypothetical protein
MVPWSSLQQPLHVISPQFEHWKATLSGWMNFALIS